MKVFDRCHAHHTEWKNKKAHWRQWRAGTKKTDLKNGRISYGNGRLTISFIAESVGGVDDPLSV
jgi:hypothetical protein